MAQSEKPPAEQMAEPVAGEREGRVDAAEAQMTPPEPSVEAQDPDGGAVPEAEATPAVAALADTEAAPQSEGSDATAPAATEGAQPAEEAALVEVWRTGRPEGRRRPRDRHRQHDKPGRTDETRRTSDQAPAIAAGGEAAAPAEQPTAGAPGKPGRRHRHRYQGGERQGERQGDRQGDRQEARHGDRHAERHDRPDRPPRDRERPQQRPARFERRERDKAPDPNSPFAKLAGLKAQLEAEAKERR
jgi:ATP-dependent RNA helicase SUPV3L1/SUV3